MADDPGNWQDLYVEIMREIRLRERVIDDLLFGDVKLGRAPRVEFSYLELRMICELIAISTLVAHGDIPATKSKRMRVAWEADRILRTMSQLRNDFFPVAMAVREGPDGEIVLGDNDKALFGPKEIISIYRACGQMLHRGNLETLGKTDTSKERCLTVARWAKKIKALVSCHAIAAYGPDGLFLWFITLDDDLKPSVKRLNRLRPEAEPSTGTGSAT